MYNTIVRLVFLLFKGLTWNLLQQYKLPAEMDIERDSDVECTGAKEVDVAKVQPIMHYFHKKPKRGENQVSILQPLNCMY